MATAKKTTKKTEAPKEEPKETPGKLPENQAVIMFTKDDPRPVLHVATPDEYIASEYPWFQTSQNIPQLLKALLREVVKGRMK